ncbi:hypothetical protein OPV22_009893 [Ensete ventricosum]|uniref:RNase H type-1 domain-containing protein n=1 Tax=Ensete ventricosum TaxID=4639 RepID=A0AAV8RG39_ENSVE|nr:hypothetical protein OPV22_009893 [Ensete ventricosum]
MRRGIPVTKGTCSPPSAPHLDHSRGAPRDLFGDLGSDGQLGSGQARKGWTETVELKEFDLEYVPRTAIKAQALADFISELTSPKSPPPTPRWTLYMDGSANSERGGARLILKGPTDQAFEYALRLEFKATNNEAEYKALLFGLRLANELHVEDIEVFTDS